MPLNCPPESQALFHFLRGAFGRCVALVASFLWQTTPLWAEQLQLLWPVECRLGASCFIQQYVDHDPSTDAADFTCGELTYDGHKGTDIALPSLEAMATEVSVRAAADGVVLGLRDEMADRVFEDTEQAAIAGRECGNGVLLRHPEGWETQYCHLAKGSVAVREGQTVKAGDRLGSIGLSGRTQFPHLHLTVRKKGRVIDPFAPQVSAPATCGAAAGTPLWKEDEVNPAPYYVASGIIATGFASDIPDFSAIKAGTANESPLSVDSSGLVLWVYAWGGRPNDTLRFLVVDPEGVSMVNATQELISKQAQYFRAVGRRLSSPLFRGRYMARVEIWRDGKLLAGRDLEMIVH